MKDLQDTTDADLVRVNVISIGAIFLIIMIIFKSISLPIILVAVIEFAIFVNMAIPYYQGISLPFVASIVNPKCHQLSATVDYAILMTTRYQREGAHAVRIRWKPSALPIRPACRPLSAVVSASSQQPSVFPVIHRLR